jgi:hypothetical protein
MEPTANERARLFWRGVIAILSVTIFLSWMVSF